MLRSIVLALRFAYFRDKKRGKKHSARLSAVEVPRIRRERRDLYKRPTIWRHGRVELADAMLHVPAPREMLGENF